MAQGDVPISPGGPLRRRREKRQLEQLAEEVARREPSEIAARTHVSLIGDEATLKVRGADEQESDAPPEPGDMRPRGFHVHPVPIGEPFSETSPASGTPADDGSDIGADASPESP